MQISTGRLWPKIGVFATRNLANYIFMGLPSVTIRSKTPFPVATALFVLKKSMSGIAFCTRTIDLSGTPSFYAAVCIQPIVALK